MVLTCCVGPEGPDLIFDLIRLIYVYIPHLHVDCAACNMSVCFHLCVQRFGMSQVKAARDLGVGLTCLKGFCRKYNIRRWPSRKIIQLQTLINDVQEFQAQDDSTGVNTDAVLEQLR